MKRKNNRTICALAFGLLGLIATADAQRTVVVRGGTLIDGTGKAPLENAVLLIEGERIKEIRTTDPGNLPPSAEIIEAKGKFIIPGLHDFHVHYRDWMYPLFINEGVTTIHDIGNNPTDWFLVQREMFQREKVAGPRLYGSVLNLWGRPAGEDPNRPSATVNLPNVVLFRTVPEAQMWAKKAVELKADYLKVHEGFTGEMLKAIAQVAKENNLAVVGHCPPGIDAFEALELGQSHFEHSTGIGRAISKDVAEVQRLRAQLDQEILGKTRNSFEGQLLEFYTVDPAKEEKLIHLLIEKKAFVEPNWIANARHITPRKKQWAYEDAEFFTNPELSFVPKDARFRWVDYYAWNYFSADLKAKFLRSYENFQKFIVKLVKAGGKVSVGTASPDVVAGIGVHREMQLLVDAGLSPLEALQAATKNIAELARKEKDLGTLEAGKYADLLILDANPLQDITNTQRIAGILKGGKKMERKYYAGFRNPIPTTETSDETSHNAPQPSLGAVEPSVTVEGAPDTVIRLRGEKFTIGSTVYFKELPIPTTYKSPQLLEATVPRELLEQVGTYPVYVMNPEPLPPLENAGKTAKRLFIVKFK